MFNENLKEEVQAALAVSTTNGQVRFLESLFELVTLPSGGIHGAPGWRKPVLAGGCTEFKSTGLGIWLIELIQPYQKGAETRLTISTQKIGELIVFKTARLGNWQLQQTIEYLRNFHCLQERLVLISQDLFNATQVEWMLQVFRGEIE